jgi:hypothetical protein
MPGSNQWRHQRYLCTDRVDRVFDFEQIKTINLEKRLNFNGLEGGTGFAMKGKTMERISSRIWVLALGVAVALGIAMAAIFLKDSGTSFLTSPTPKPTERRNTASILIHETVKKLEHAIPRTY